MQFKLMMVLANSSGRGLIRMIRKRSITVLSAIAFTIALIFAGQPAQADWGVSFYGEASSPRYSYYGDRLTSEYRRGYQIDDWVERGASSVTESPVFTDGIRLASWATRYEDDHDFGMASGIYFFEVPARARSVRIKIYYEGEADRDDFDNGIAGRVWIRRAYIGNDYTEYYPDEARNEGEDQPLYGDTFALRARKHLEILRMSAQDHVIDGMMELHIVAEGRQRIDVKYIEVESYSYAPSVRVVTRYQRDYAWRPWYDYTYSYFYTGPTFHFSDHFYVRYTYPHYRQNYVTVRKRYNNYLRGYYANSPSRRVRWTNVARVSAGTRRTWKRDRLNRWTQEYSAARKSYVITSAKRRRPDEIKKSRTRVRSVLASRNRVSPATTRARAGITGTTRPVQRKTATQTRSSSASGVRTRRESSTPQRREQYRGSTSQRTRTDTSRSSSQPTKRVETPTRTRSSSSSSRSPVRTRSTSSSRREPERSVKQTPTKQTPARSVRESKTTQTKPKREVTRTRTETRKSQPTPKRAPSTPTKKDDDDDDEDDKKKSSTRTRSSSSSSSSSTTKRVRSRSR